MITVLDAGPYRLTGTSLAGIYTSICVPQLDAVLDAGFAVRAHAAPNNIFVSHTHPDHIGALPALLGIRTLLRRPPARVFAPAATMVDIREGIAALTRSQRYPVDAEYVEVSPGDSFELRRDMWVRVFETHHTIPSVGYQFYRPVQRLRSSYRALPGHEIARLRKAGADLFENVVHNELAYATDTLLDVIDTHPSLLSTRVLILECSFLDERKSLAETHAGCHIHLDELVSRADDFANEHIVLMHFSQLWSPAEVREILHRRCPPNLLRRISVFAPEDHWT